MSLTLPLIPSVQHYDFQITLDGVDYTLEFRWNRRELSWYMTVREVDGTPIHTSIKVVIDHPLGGRTRDVRWPPGAFMAIDTSTQGADPGLDDLGDRVVIIYFTRSELPIDISVSIES